MDPEEARGILAQKFDDSDLPRPQRVEVTGEGMQLARAEAVAHALTALTGFNAFVGPSGMGDRHIVVLRVPPSSGSLRYTRGDHEFTSGVDIRAWQRRHPDVFDPTKNPNAK